jgi:hypothetical protein
MEEEEGEEEEEEEEGEMGKTQSRETRAHSSFITQFHRPCSDTREPRRRGRIAD